MRWFEPNAYEVSIVQLNPSGRELFWLMGIVLGAERGGFPYPRQVESQFKWRSGLSFSQEYEDLG